MGCLHYGRTQFPKCHLLVTGESMCEYKAWVTSVMLLWTSDCKTTQIYYGVTWEDPVVRKMSVKWEIGPDMTTWLNVFPQHFTYFNNIRLRKFEAVKHLFIGAYGEMEHYLGVECLQISTSLLPVPKSLTHPVCPVVVVTTLPLMMWRLWCHNWDIRAMNIWAAKHCKRDPPLD